jgi:hypothetical protein
MENLDSFEARSVCDRVDEEEAVVLTNVVFVEITRCRVVWYEHTYGLSEWRFGMNGGL